MRYIVTHWASPLVVRVIKIGTTRELRDVLSNLRRVGRSYTVEDERTGELESWLAPVAGVSVADDDGAAD